MRRRALCAASSGGSKYLTMEALQDGFTAKLSQSSCEYSIDGGVEWKALAAGVSTPPINAGEKILFKATATPQSGYGIGTFTLSKQCNLSGNCMSMLYGDDADKYDHVGQSAFQMLFSGAKQIIGVSKDFLPARVVSSSCYSSMFNNCANMISAPDLPAKALAGYCYNYMFYGCTKITNPPRLAATVLANYCCYWMFGQCTSLQSAPALLAETLVNSFYNYMFYDCTNLKYIKAMFLTAPGSDTSSWVTNVASSGTFVKNKNATWRGTGTSRVPKDWTVITE